ncbi:MAG TPA: hypothetical protein VN840_02845 [Streptosporangiaceae bacterium]|nr:hypothetical protein [Streptosporangiaceae bacterium]
MRWSVGIEADSDRVLSREEVVELADAVAAYDGIATGIGTSRYGAQLVVRAASREAAIELATRQFARAAAQARLPEGPIVRAEAISEDEDEGLAE